MTQQLTILLLDASNASETAGTGRAGGQPKQIGLLAGERVSIGRECPEGISVEVAGVSRTHGEFVRVRSQYVFADLGSTNGSWVNGRKVDPTRPVVVRAGDTLQLAAAPLKIGSGGGVKSDVPSLLVVRGELAQPSAGGVLLGIEEFPIPAAGVVMTLGGPQSDIYDCGEEPCGRVLKEDGGLALEVLSDAVTLNGQVPMGPKAPVGDNDVISCGEVRVIVNIPPRISSGPAVRGGGVFGTVAGPGGRDIADTVRVAPGAVDRAINPEATTAVLGGESFQGIDEVANEEEEALGRGDTHPNRRFSDPSQFESNPLGLSPLEVKLVIVMAIMLFASVFLLGLWWFSQNK